MSLIVIEGLDGSGKGTQSQRLLDYLEKEQIPCRKITFPDYDSDSSALVKMYLSGEFGSDAESVNAYAASSFYAVDRFASFSSKWGNDYKSGKLILADRYTTSNIVYQLTKMPEAEWDEFCSWTTDFEFVKMGLPVPDKVIYLDMPPEVSQKLLIKRYNGEESKKDIHESNVSFLHRCRKSAMYAAEKYGWSVIPCSENGEPRSLDDIHNDIIAALKDCGIIGR